MKLSCGCGNEFDFGNPDTTPEGGEMEGFEFETGENEKHGDYLIIHCKKCDQAIVLHSEPNEEDSEEEDED